MKKIISKLKESGMLWVVAGCAVFIIVALVTFLGKGGTTVSGWQIIANQTFGEWFWMLFASAIAGVVVWAYIKFYKKTQDSKGIVPFAIAFMLFISIAFGKACTDKANEGVTSGKGRPGGAAQVDSTRIPAEDLIPKK